MGYIMHDAIIVTAFRDQDAVAGRDKAEELGLPVSNLVRSMVNGYTTFLIAPDGSKEGWSDSDKYDGIRARWLEWAHKAYADGMYLKWCHVRYGESPAYTVGEDADDEEAADAR